LTTAKAHNNDAGEAGASANGRDTRWLHWKRRFAHLARWLHTYLSMLSFALLLFFAATGLTLNHAEWFDAHQRPQQIHGVLNVALVNSADPEGVAKEQLVRYFRESHHTKGAVSDFHIDGEQCELLFKGPGYEADAVIDRKTGNYDLTVSPFSPVAILNDLHKGRDTGTKWSAVIDFSAILMSLVSLTGLSLIFFLNKRRLSGLILVAVGALLGWLIYSFWVS
jgi:uncharacterized protein